MNRMIIYICLLSFLGACTIAAKEPDIVTTTVSGTVFHKYYNTPCKNTLVIITRDEFDLSTLTSTTETIGTTYTDDKGYFNYSFPYYKKYYGVKIGTAYSYPAQPVNKGENHYDFKVAPPVVVKTAIHFYNNRYPPMSVGIGYTSYYDSPLWEKFSGDTTIYQVCQYDQPFKITYTNYKTVDSGAIERTINLGAYADTLSVKDTIDMGFK